MTKNPAPDRRARKAQKSKLRAAIARAAVAEARALDAQIALALARQRNESLQREVTHRICADINMTVDHFCRADDVIGRFEFAGQLGSDPALLQLTRLHFKPQKS